MIKKIMYAVSLFFSLTATAQTITDVARSKEITWYGIDYSKVKFSGFEDQNFEANLRNFIKDLSYSPPTSGQLYWLTKTLGKENVLVNTDISTRKNIKINPKELIISGSSYLDIDTIKAIVRDMQISEEGYGILLVAEFFDRKNKFAQFWVAFINNQNGKLITARRYSGILDFRVLGFDNRWHDAVETVIKNIGRDLKKSQ